MRSNVDVLYLEDGNAYRPVLKNKMQLFFSSKNLSVYIRALSIFYIANWIEVISINCLEIGARFGNYFISLKTGSILCMK